ncbi:hypothetical protein T492DRAFT_849461 [Pavlovales sp. CCMP2436]|nr:hypothetical protein T492DRAFT_849461 [Pavlovales sp. CCMP2436]
MNHRRRKTGEIKITNKCGMCYRTQARIIQDHKNPRDDFRSQKWSTSCTPKMDPFQTQLELERNQTPWVRMSQAAAAAMIARARPARYANYTFQPQAAPSRAGRTFFKVSETSRFQPQVQKTVDRKTQRENIAIFKDLYWLYGQEAPTVKFNDGSLDSLDAEWF